MARSPVIARTFRIASFIAIVTIPSLGAIRGTSSLVSEKRVRSPRPALSWDGLSSYPDKFNNYWRDTFGFRDELIGLHNLIEVKWFHESPVSNVIIGSKGVLFFAGGPVDFTDFSGKWPVSEANLDSILQHLLRRRDEYRALGAAFLVTIAPNNQTVYPESVPSKYGPAAPGLLDALLLHLRTHSDLDVLDLRATLEAHRDEGLYYRTDTHWNATGAFRAAQAIIERARRRWPQVQPLRFEDFEFTEEAKWDGDLATMLSMAGKLEDVQVICRRRGGDRAHLLGPDTELNESTYEQPLNNGLRVLMFGDSFGAGLARPLAEAFGRLHFSNAARLGYQPTLPAAEKPDLVILEAVERYVPNLAVH
jgi:alginate O-acetyltransferase complex protein AlgJ